MTLINNIFSFLLENYQNRKLLKFIPKNIHTVIDVGAHEGELYKTLIKKNIKFRKFIMFEPFKESYNSLLKLSDDRLIIHNVGLSDLDEILKLNVNKIKLTNSFTSQNTDTLNFKIKNLLAKKNQFLDPQVANLNRLDNVVKLDSVNSPTLLKIDTEGFELKVLHGGSKLFENEKIDYVLVEVHKPNTYPKYEPSKIYDYLENHNFKIVKKFKFPLIGFSDVLFRLDR